MAKNERDELMERVAAATTMLRRTGSFKRTSELDAFMSIFHPEVFKDRKRMQELRGALRNPDERI